MPKAKAKAKAKPETQLKPSAAFKKKFDILQALRAQGIERDPRKCIYKKNDKFCERWAIAGGTVCPKHGGNIAHVKKAAQARMQGMLLRKVERLDEISEQNIHMPSALGATQSIINRVMGKVGDGPKRDGSAPTIQIGISLVSGSKPAIAVAQLTPPPEDAIDADFDVDDED